MKKQIIDELNKLSASIIQITGQVKGSEGE